MNILDLCIPIHDSSGKKSSIFNWILKLTHFPLLSAQDLKEVFFLNNKLPNNNSIIYIKIIEFFAFLEIQFKIF